MSRACLRRRQRPHLLQYTVRQQLNRRQGPCESGRRACRIGRTHGDQACENRDRYSAYEDGPCAHAVGSGRRIPAQEDRMRPTGCGSGKRNRGSGKRIRSLRETECASRLSATAGHCRALGARDSLRRQSSAAVVFGNGTGAANSNLTLRRRRSGYGRGPPLVGRGSARQTVPEGGRVPAPPKRRPALGQTGSRAESDSLRSTGRSRCKACAGRRTRLVPRDPAIAPPFSA